LTKDKKAFTYPSLMGAVKVLTIDGEKIEQKSGICSMINEQLFKN